MPKFELRRARAAGRFTVSPTLRILGGVTAIGLASCAQAAPAFDADSPYMTGDWGGERTHLHDLGYDFKMEYVGESGSNLHGGYNHDHATRYSDQFALGVHMDLQKILGWHDAEFQLTLTDRNGDNITNDRVADPRTGGISSSQEVYGRGSIVRITQMYYEQKFLDQKLDIKVGRFGEGEDFNTFQCDFQNLGFCGSQVGNWATGIWYNWPVSQWAARVKYHLNDEVYAQVGAYALNPSNLENGNGFKLNNAGTTGAVLPVELVFTPKINNLPGEYRVGYYYSTANAKDVYKDTNGQPAALSGGDYRSSSSKHGYWLTLNQQLTAQASDNSRGLSVFGNVTVHDKKTNMVDNYVQAGVVYKGLFDARPKDDIGFALARIHVNPAYRKNEEATNAANGVTDYNDPDYMPIQRTETSAELNYGVHVTNWLTVRPNLQYIKHPGGVDEVDNALVAGIKVQSSF